MPIPILDANSQSSYGSGHLTFVVRCIGRSAISKINQKTFHEREEHLIEAEEVAAMPYD